LSVPHRDTTVFARVEPVVQDREREGRGHAVAEWLPSLIGPARDAVHRTSTGSSHPARDHELTAELDGHLRIFVDARQAESRLPQVFARSDARHRRDGGGLGHAARSQGDERRTHLLGARPGIVRRDAIRAREVTRELVQVFDGERRRAAGLGGGGSLSE
jgi:hypothetical protein